jgi:hypothetical protein
MPSLRDIARDWMFVRGFGSSTTTLADRVGHRFNVTMRPRRVRLRNVDRPFAIRLGKSDYDVLWLC